MNVALLAMPKSEARMKLRAVRQQLHRRADAEYERLEAAYKEAANGRPLLSLSEAIGNAPRDKRGRPRLAIARADRRQVALTFDGARPARTARFDTRVNGAWRRDAGRTRGLSINVPYRHDLPTTNEWDSRGFALVPIVPPDVRGHHALDRHHILWEVEQWSETRIGARPDRDPYLLRHIGGDLWAVIAEWDLTNIERAVMSGRAEG